MLTEDQVEMFRRDGYLVVPDVIPVDTAAAALRHREEREYGMTHAEYVAHIENGGESRRPEQATTLPTGIDELDSLVANDDWLDIFAQLLGTNTMRLIGVATDVRCGVEDRLRPGAHIDNESCSMFGPMIPWERNAFLESWCLLNDIEDDGAPLHVVPGSHRQVPSMLRDLIKTGKFTDHFDFPDLSKVVEFAEPVPLTGTAGSVFMYSSYLVHMAVPFQNKHQQRVIVGMSLCHAENSPWTSCMNRHAGLSVEQQNRMIDILARTTPRFRTLLGWPPPGDAFYTPDTLEMLAEWYPGIDLSPYQ